jgi:hypothetical protein
LERPLEKEVYDPDGVLAGTALQTTRFGPKGVVVGRPILTVPIEGTDALFEDETAGRWVDSKGPQRAKGLKEPGKKAAKNGLAGAVFIVEPEGPIIVENAHPRIDGNTHLRPNAFRSASILAEHRNRFIAEIVIERAFVKKAIEDVGVLSKLLKGIIRPNVLIAMVVNNAPDLILLFVREASDLFEDFQRNTGAKLRVLPIPPMNYRPNVVQKRSDDTNVKWQIALTSQNCRKLSHAGLVLQFPADAALARRIGQIGVQEEVHNVPLAPSDTITGLDEISLEVVVFTRRSHLVGLPSRPS